MANPIFISYRRDDSEGEAGRLFDDLARAFGEENVFMDVAGIRPGIDFRKAIEDNVAHCGVLLAIVGPTWLSIANPAGQRRLDDPNDFVALEIASALQRDVPVIPVLVHGARMPHAAELPTSLENFSYRNSVEISHARWNSDVQLLIDALAAYVNPGQQAALEPVHATIPAQLPEPHPVAPQPTPAKKRSRLPLIAAAALVLLVAVLAGLHFMGSRPSIAQELEGNWKDPTPRPGNNLATLDISISASTVFLHASGDCNPTPCDWGIQAADLDGSAATATFKFPNDPSAPAQDRVAVVTVSRTGTDLDVSIHNTFSVDNDARETQIHRTFVPAS